MFIKKSRYMSGFKITRTGVCVHVVNSHLVKNGNSILPNERAMDLFPFPSQKHNSNKLHTIPDILKTENQKRINKRKVNEFKPASFNTCSFLLPKILFTTSICYKPKGRTFLFKVISCSLHVFTTCSFHLLEILFTTSIHYKPT